MNTKKRKNLLAYTMAFAMIILMAAASELSHNHEFILPEIAAMVIAMWVYRDPNWLRHPLQICLAPTLTSVIGFTINHLHAAYLCKVGIDFILIMACLRLIQSNFAPSLATGLLPLITDGHDWKLVLIIFLATLILMLVVIFFRMNASLEKKEQIHYKYTYFFLCLIFMWIGDLRYAVKPFLKSPVREIRAPGSVGVRATSWVVLTAIEWQHQSLG